MVIQLLFHVHFQNPWSHKPLLIQIFLSHEVLLEAIGVMNKLYISNIVINIWIAKNHLHFHLMEIKYNENFEKIALNISKLYSPNRVLKKPLNCWKFTVGAMNYPFHFINVFNH